MKTYSKFEVAKLLDISPSRVKQLVNRLGLVPERGPRGEYKFIQYHIAKMRERNKKPGPQPNGKR